MLVHSGASLHESGPPLFRPPIKPGPFIRSAIRPQALINSRHIPDVSLVDGLPSLNYTKPDQVEPLVRPSCIASTGISHKRNRSVRFESPAATPLASPSGTFSEEDDTIFTSALNGIDIASEPSQRKKRVARPSTSFALAKPAAQLGSRPTKNRSSKNRLLLQVQQNKDNRPLPVYDVVPAIADDAATTVPKLARHLPKRFRAHQQLGENDALIVCSENYGQGASLEDPAGNEKISERDILGVICTSSHHDHQKFEIALKDGSSWRAEELANESYEFSTSDAMNQPTVARWVRRAVKPTKARSRCASEEIGVPSYKWTFSIIDPTTTRHPILGVLKQEGLVIYDTYQSISSSTGVLSQGHSLEEDDQLPAPEEDFPSPASLEEPRITMRIEDAHKKLMLATAIWINLRQAGWPTITRLHSPPSMSKLKDYTTTTMAKRMGSRNGAISSLPLSAQSYLENQSFDSSYTTNRDKSASPAVAYVKRRQRSRETVVEEHTATSSSTQHEVTSISLEKTAAYKHRIRRLADQLLHRRRTKI